MVVALSEFVFVGNGVDDRVKLIDVGSDARSGLFNAWVDFGDDGNARVNRDGVAANFSEKIIDGADAEVDPLAEARVLRIAELDVFARVEARLLAEGGDGGVVEAGPRVFPAGEVRHPVRNVDVDAVDTSGCDLAHALHVKLAPCGRVGGYPHILFAFGDPESGVGAENSGLSRDLALQPARMIFREGMRAVGVLRNTFGSGDVDEGFVVGLMRGERDLANRCEFGGRIEQTFVPAGDIVVDFDSVNAAGLGPLNDLLRVVRTEWEGGDADLAHPVAIGAVGGLSVQNAEAKEHEAERTKRSGTSNEHEVLRGNAVDGGRARYSERRGLPQTDGRTPSSQARGQN